MPKKTKIPKLLAPVRDEKSFTAALSAGADAVYFGVGELNMRISSKGIDFKTLPSIVKKAHSQSVKVYITLNSVIYDEELSKLDKILDKLKKANVDAVICHDQAVIQKCKEKKITFHLSTQANISNSEAAKYYEKLGAKCIVLARECTLKQIAKAKKNLKKAKIEVFCHGAMCVSVSGRCFISQFLQCKSANRGNCFQPCRREYLIKDTEEGHELIIGKGYVMSPKDLCTLQILDKLVKTGADILKIEGRSRSPEYIYTVTRAYRTALDAIADKKYNQSLAKKLITEIRKVYNRDFSTGFLFGAPASEGWANRSQSKATEKKKYVGKITNYFKKTGIAEVTLPAGKLKKGDEIYIQGNKTGSIRLKISELKKHPDEFFTFPSKEVLRRNDEVYKIVKVKR